MASIQSYAQDVPDPYGLHGTSITQGLMKGQIKMTRRLKLGHEQTRDKVCLWFDTVNVTFEIDPKIIIAREVKQDRCMHKAVLDHEIHHVDIDRQVVNEASQRLAKRFYRELKRFGFVHGPLRFDEATAKADEMAALIDRITGEEYDRLGKIRNQRQMALDTPEEYARVAALCPGFVKRRQALFQKVQIQNELEAKKRSRYND